MSRLLRIVIFSLLIAAIVFFGFRASQPVEKIPPSGNLGNLIADTPAVDTPAVKAQTDGITSPDLKDLSVDADDKKEGEIQEKEVNVNSSNKEKGKTP